MGLGHSRHLPSLPVDILDLLSPAQGDKHPAGKEVLFYCLVLLNETLPAIVVIDGGTVVEGI